NYFDRNVAVALTIRGRAVATVDSNVFEGNGQRLDERGNAYDAVRIGGTAQVILSRHRFNDHPRFGLSLFDNAVVSASGNVYEGNGGYSQIDTQYHSSVLVGDEASYTGSNDRFVGNVGGALELDDNARAELTEAVVSGNGSNAA